jgi:hypothetical protein
MNLYLQKAFFALIFSLCVSSAQAGSIAMLTIDGMLGPGDAGSYPVDALFSWSEHRYPGETVGHVWTLAPGTDGGIFLAQAQPSKGGMTAKRDMYNMPSWFYSVGNGITINADESLDFENFRMSWGGTILDLGNVPGYSASIPKLADISQLSGTSNGWVLQNDGTYNLIFRSAGLCDGCELTVHLHGTAHPVPLPSAFWLLGAGLAAGLSQVSYRRRSQTSPE